MLDRSNCFTWAESAGTEADFEQNINGTEISTNVINMDTAGLSIAGDNGPYLIVRANAAGSGTGTIQIQLVSSTEAALTGGTSNIIQTWKFADTVITAGAVLINQRLPIGKYRLYLGLNFVVSTTTCAKIVAYLSDAPESVTGYLPALTA
jgi:hypothetical protein